MVIDGHHILHHTKSAAAVKYDPQEIDELIAYMDRCGVDQIAAENVGVQVPNLEEVVFRNLELAKCMRHAPDRVLGMAVINPQIGEPMLDHYRECIEGHGMVGLKVWLACKADDPSIDPFVEYNIRNRKITFIHSWYRNGVDSFEGRETGPAEVIALANRFREAAIVQMHHGAQWFQGALMTKYAPSNVYQGISAAEGMGVVEVLVDYLGARRLIWGCDQRRFSARATVTAAAISESNKRLILGDNLDRLIHGEWDHLK